jgi:multiple antibiotic resistance protein
MDTIYSILSLSFTLFLLMDALGNIPLFISILKDLNPKAQRKVIRREMCIALGIIIAFHFFGKILLEVIDVKQETIQIAGGIILFLIALNMIFPSTHSENEHHSKYKGTPLVVPLAIPLIAGPAVLAAVMLYSEQKTQVVAISSIVIAWLMSVVILTSASNFKKILGEKGLLACERLMGLLLTLIAVQMFLKGIALFISNIGEF